MDGETQAILFQELVWFAHDGFRIQNNDGVEEEARRRAPHRIVGENSNEKVQMVYFGHFVVDFKRGIQLFIKKKVNQITIKKTFKRKIHQ